MCENAHRHLGSSDRREAAIVSQWIKGTAPAPLIARTTRTADAVKNALKEALPAGVVVQKPVPPIAEKLQAPAAQKTIIPLAASSHPGPAPEAITKPAAPSTHLARPALATRPASQPSAQVKSTPASAPLSHPLSPNNIQKATRIRTLLVGARGRESALYAQSRRGNHQAQQFTTWKNRLVKDLAGEFGLEARSINSPSAQAELYRKVFALLGEKEGKKLLPLFLVNPL